LGMARRRRTRSDVWSTAREWCLVWLAPTASDRVAGLAQPVRSAETGGRSAVGSASPCQGEGRGFESRRPLGRGAGRSLGMPPRWDGREARQRPAKPCTRVRIPFPPRITRPRRSRAISSAGERFPDTEEVTGSIPVSPTSIFACRQRQSDRCKSEPVCDPLTAPLPPHCKIIRIGSSRQAG
jgi:hypothetical protein